MAIEDRGGPLLVSAAAGSGKTRVLIERLLNRVLSEGSTLDIDSFLIITYTNAAASELRGKILDSIYERIALDPENRRLRRQADICGRAQISTIHGFCSKVIRENAHLIDINPGFRVADETESRALLEDVLSDMLEEAYSSMEPGFLSLADTIGAGRDDEALCSLIIEAYEKLLSHPYPRKWVETQLNELVPRDGTELAASPWGRIIIDKISAYTDYAVQVTVELMNEADSDEAVKKALGASLEATYEGLRRLRKSLKSGWDEIRAATSIDFPRSGRLTGEQYQWIKDKRKSLKEGLEKLESLMHDSAEKCIADMGRVMPEIKTLFDFVLRLDEKFKEQKKKKGIIDFHDQEHLALKILVDPTTGAPTETASGLAQRYEEIMVDEYQDVNEIQELIFNAVSRNGNNVFMVGDVKQSIYRFRLADPSIFINKYLSFKDAGEAKEGEGRKILLSDNFRSRKGILDGTNYVFRNTMSKAFGDIDYSDREALRFGAKGYCDNDEADIELNVINIKKPDDEETDESPDKTEAEAEYAAKRIRELMSSHTVLDGNGTRPMKYGDIAVIMRSPNSRASIWIETLSRAGIPAQFGSESGFFEAPEISMAIAFAAVIDNPRQDIPLITVLRSPVYGLTSQELANIRSEHQKSDYYSACEAFYDKNTKLKKFLDELSQFRLDAQELPADELLWKVFTKTGFFAAVSAMPGGEKRLRNVIRLIETARTVESTGYKGVFGFVAYINKMMEQGKTLSFEDGGAHSDSVTIMSIHKSKGLEFPVVILADTAHGFNDSDAKIPLLIHSQYGIGTDLVDLKRRIRYPTLAKKAIKLAIEKESMSEELRILYVAMTRAREKLIILASYTDAEKKLTGMIGTPLPVPPVLMEKARSLADFILLPALSRPEFADLRSGSEVFAADPGDKRWAVNLIDYNESDYDDDTERDREKQAADELIFDAAPFIEAQYQYPDTERIPSKLTATELKGRFFDIEAHEDADEINRARIKLYAPVRPDFSAKGRALTSVQKGTALHLVMQYADFRSSATVSGAEKEIERLRIMKYLTDEEAKSVDPRIVSRFLCSDTGRLIMRAQNVWRELKFSLLSDSGEFPDYPGGERVLLQGVIDCVIENEGKLTVIDYKTDRVEAETAQQRAQYYSGQLAAYAYAAQRILKKPVEKRIVHFLAADLAFEV